MRQTLKEQKMERKRWLDNIKDLRKALEASNDIEERSCLIVSFNRTQEAFLAQYPDGIDDINWAKDQAIREYCKEREDAQRKGTSQR